MASRCRSVRIEMPYLDASNITDMRPEREVAERSVLIKNIVGDLGEEALAEAIPITNVCHYKTYTEVKLDCAKSTPGQRSRSQESNRVVHSS